MTIIFLPFKLISPPLGSFLSLDCWGHKLDCNTSFWFRTSFSFILFVTCVNINDLLASPLLSRTPGFSYLTLSGLTGFYELKKSVTQTSRTLAKTRQKLTAKRATAVKPAGTKARTLNVPFSR